MNSEAKALWVASLRDGSFRKGLYGLRDLDDYYDATGVLCELAVLAGVIPPAKRWDKPEAQHFFGYTYGEGTDRFAVGLPKAVQEWAGITYRDGFHVAIMGDRGKSFIEIADWIEENL